MRRVWGPGGTGNKGEGALCQQLGVNTQGQQEMRGQDEPQGSRLSHGGRSIFLALLGMPQPQQVLSVGEEWIRKILHLHLRPSPETMVY